MGAILTRGWFASAPRRRMTFAALAAILGVLVLWPEHYEAEAELMPQKGGGGLSGVIAEQASGALLNLGALAGEKPSIESDLTIARSQVVLRKVIAQLHLLDRPGYHDERRAEVKLAKKLRLLAIRGSILQISANDRDRTFAKSLVGAVASAVQERLAEISREEAAQKRAVTVNRLADAEMRLTNSQAALNQFRAAHNLPAPEQQLSSGVGILALLQSRLESTEVQLRALRQVATGDNIQVKVLESEVASLQEQIATVQASNNARSSQNLTGLSALNLEYLNLYRTERSNELLEQVYKRYLDELEVDELSATQNLDLIEPPYVNPERQYNVFPLAGLLLVIMAAIASEYYLVRAPGVRA